MILLNSWFLNIFLAIVHQTIENYTNPNAAEIIIRALASLIPAIIIIVINRCVWVFISPFSFIVHHFQWIFLALKLEITKLMKQSV